MGAPELELELEYLLPLLRLPLLLVLLLSVTRHARSKLTITTLLNATLQSNVPAQKKNCGRRGAPCGACAVIGFAVAPAGVVSAFAAMRQ